MAGFFFVVHSGCLEEPVYPLWGVNQQREQTNLLDLLVFAKTSCSELNFTDNEAPNLSEDFDIRRDVAFCLKSVDLSAVPFIPLIACLVRSPDFVV
jgi:hypothetical protein